MIRYWVFCALIGWVGLAHAQEADTVQLKEVLISAPGERRDEMPAPGLQPVSQSTDLLDKIPGVVRAQENSFPVSYRGQHGSRLRIQQNGARRVGLNPQGYLAQDLNVANLKTARMVNGIERAIYGSGAIGGVMVLEDESADTRLPASVFFNYGTNNQAKHAGVNWQGDLRKATIRLAGSGLVTNNFQFSEGQEALNSKLNERNFSTALNLPIGTNRIQWRQSFSDGTWQFPQGFQNNPFELRDLNNAYTYQTDVKVTSKLRNQWLMTNQVWNLRLETDQTQDQYDPTFEMINRRITRSYTRRGLGYNGAIEKRTNRLAIKTGLDVFASQLEEYRVEEDRVNNINEEELAALRDDGQAGTYMRVATQQGQVQWTGVVRFDVSLTKNLLADRATYTALTGGLQMNTSLWGLDHEVYAGRFFRFPRPEESGGELAGGRGIFRGNPDILPEYSYQLEWAITKKLKTLTLRVNSWVAFFQDRIVEVPIDRNVFLYDNVDQARTLGIEWSLTSTLHEDKIQKWTGSLSGLAMRGDDISRPFESGTRSAGIPPTNFKATLQYFRNVGEQITLDIGADVSRTLAFTAPDGFNNQVWAVQDAPGFTLVGLRVGSLFRIGTHDLTVSAVATNLTDQGYFPFGSRIMGMGRNFRMGVKYSF